MTAGISKKAGNITSPGIISNMVPVRPRLLFVRNQSSLLAFTLPPKWRSGAGLSIVATHVDSPNLRIRPTSMKSSMGYCQVTVETFVDLP